MSLSGKVFECNRLLVFLTIVCLFVEALESPLLADHYRGRSAHIELEFYNVFIPFFSKANGEDGVVASQLLMI